MRTPCRLAILAALCALALSGCSNGKFAYAKALGDIATVTGVSTGLEEKAPSNDPTAPSAAEGPPLIVGFNAIRVAIPYAGMSGGSKTYVSPDGVTLAMNSGFVTRATGLGLETKGVYLKADSPLFDDLTAAANAGASTDRVVEYWERERIKRDKFRCALASTPREGGGVVVDETCKRYFEPFTFVNRFWMTADNKIECSRQWIHPKLSPLQFFATEQQAVSLDLTQNGC